MTRLATILCLCLLAFVPPAFAASAKVCGGRLSVMM